MRMSTYFYKGFNAQKQHNCHTSFHIYIYIYIYIYIQIYKKCIGEHFEHIIYINICDQG